MVGDGAATAAADEDLQSCVNDERLAMSVGGVLTAGSWAAPEAPDPAQSQEERLANMLGERRPNGRRQGGRKSPFDTPPALARRVSSSSVSGLGKTRRGKRESEDHLLDTFAVHWEDGRG